MRHASIISSVALVAIVLSGCRTDPQVAQNGVSSRSPGHRAELIVPAGTSVDITLTTPLTSENAGVGDAWSGTTRTDLTVDGRNLVPAGSAVAGTVTSVTPARQGDRAMLDLGLTSITVGNHSYRVRGSMESVVAGSPRARNLGAIGAAAAAGAIVGHAIGGSDKSTIIGAIVGGGAATGAVSQTKGWQVVLKDGTPLTFTTHQDVAVRS